MFCLVIYFCFCQWRLDFFTVLLHLLIMCSPVLQKKTETKLNPVCQSKLNLIWESTVKKSPEMDKWNLNKRLDVSFIKCYICTMNFSSHNFSSNGNFQKIRNSMQLLSAMKFQVLGSFPKIKLTPKLPLRYYISCCILN